MSQPEAWSSFGREESGDPLSWSFLLNATCSYLWCANQMFVYPISAHCTYSKDVYSLIAFRHLLAMRTEKVEIWACLIAIRMIYVLNSRLHILHL